MTHPCVCCGADITHIPVCEKCQPAYDLMDRNVKQVVMWGLRKAKDSARLDYVLDNQAIVIEGSVMLGCDWKKFKQAIHYFGPITQSLATQRRAAIDAARGAE